MRTKVLRSFDCSDNKLTTLEGAPEWVGNNCWIERNRLISLEWFPKYVGGRKIILYDNQLKNLIGLPKEFEMSLDISGNPLESLEGIPKKLDDVDMRFIFDEYRNFKFTYKDVIKVCKVRGEVLI